MKINPLSRTMLVPLALVLASALFPAGIVLAAKHDDHLIARELLKRGEILPLNQILEVVQRRVPGDVIEVELEHEEEGWEYEVKVLTPTGHVRKISLNARNGAVLKIKDD